LESVEDRIVLTVRDDGVGLPEHARDGKGMGLRIMEYRARMMGASLLTARNPQGGTRISCAVSRKA